MQKQPKICVKCGRDITWRKKWERCWAEVKYCSDKCRKNKNSPKDDFLEAQILELIALAPLKPSELLQQMPAREQSLEEVRMATRRLEAKGKVELRQKGRKVSSSYLKGDYLVQLHKKR